MNAYQCIVFMVALMAIASIVITAIIFSNKEKKDSAPKENYKSGYLRTDDLNPEIEAKVVPDESCNNVVWIDKPWSQNTPGKFSMKKMKKFIRLCHKYKAIEKQYL